MAANPTTEMKRTSYGSIETGRITLARNAFETGDIQASIMAHGIKEEHT